MPDKMNVCKEDMSTNIEQSYQISGYQRLQFTVLRYLYSLLFFLCLPFLVCRLLWRSRKNPSYRKHILERFGIIRTAIPPGGIWVHAVSLGESIAVTPLLRELQKSFPDLSVTVTNTTPTGREQIYKSLGHSVFQLYFPFDLPWIWNLFLNKIKPKICIIMETELWPNAILACADRNIPILIANARLSERSLNRYQYCSVALKNMLSKVTTVAAQSIADGQRYITLGLPPAALTITGNIKFDLKLPEELSEKAHKLRMLVGKDRPIWIAASTHGGEEEIILQAFSQIRIAFPELLLILVPRHPERFSVVEGLLQKSGFSYVTRSSQQPLQSDTQVFLGDTMGELLLLYAISDFAFVGGSFQPIGGHNTLEPAALSLPIVVGPHTHNFVEITKWLKQAQGLEQVSTVEALSNTVLNWLNNRAAAVQTGQAAKTVVVNNQGALSKLLSQVKTMIAPQSLNC